MNPLLTLAIHESLLKALHAGSASLECSLDLGRANTSIELAADFWRSDNQRYPYLTRCKDRTIYYWTGTTFEPAARFTGSLIKLVPTDWGPPTFEIDGIKMLPTLKVSPFADAQAKVAMIQPSGKIILDTCGGLGYFAAHCLIAGATQVLSFEKNPDVIWLRSLNPWSPPVGGALRLTLGDIVEHLPGMAAESVDAILHDPPRFGIAGELYSQSFYVSLARVLKRKGRLFHYTGTPNRLTSGRDLPSEVSRRLQSAGFTTEIAGDGILAVKRG